MTRIYATRFDLDRPGRTAATVGAQTVEQMWAWAFPDELPTKKWEKGEWRTEGREVVCDQARRRDASFYRLILTHPAPADPAVTWRWITDLVVGAERVQFGLLLEEKRSADVEGAPASLVATPDLVLTLVDGGARSGRIQLSTRATDIRGEDEVRFLAEDWLLDPQRTIPVVVFTSRLGLGAGDGRYAVDRAEIDAVAGAAAGQAKVVCLPVAGETRVLGSALPERREVFNGAARIYWPGVGSGTHPLHLADRVNRFVLQSMVTTMRAAATQTYRISRTAAELEAEHQRTTQGALVQGRLQATQDLQERLEVYGREVEALLEESMAKSKQLADREERIAELETDVTRLQLEGSHAHRLWERHVASAEARRTQAEQLLEQLEPFIDGLRVQAQAPEEELAEQPVDGRPPEDELQPEPEPVDIDEALLWAMERFAGTLEITHDAAETATRQITDGDVPPARLWSALAALDEVASRWQRDEVPPGGRALSLKELGFPVGRISMTALGQHRHNYEFTYNGVRVHVDQHVRLSRRHRIYWYENEAERRFVINHIGIHLPDSGSG